MVLQFSLVALLSDYNKNKHSNIVEHINWISSELSVGVHKTVNRIGCTCISHNIKKTIIARYDIYCKVQQLNTFLAHICSLKKCYKYLATGYHACSLIPGQISIDILLQQQKVFDQNLHSLLHKMIYNLFLRLMNGGCILSFSPCQPLHAVGYPSDCPNIVCLIRFPNINKTPKQNYSSQVEKISRYPKENELDVFLNTCPCANPAYNVISAYLIFW